MPQEESVCLPLWFLDTHTTRLFEFDFSNLSLLPSLGKRKDSPFFPSGAVVLPLFLPRFYFSLSHFLSFVSPFFLSFSLKFSSKETEWVIREKERESSTVLQDKPRQRKWKRTVLRLTKDKKRTEKSWTYVQVEHQTERRERNSLNSFFSSFLSLIELEGEKNCSSLSILFQPPGSLIKNTGIQYREKFEGEKRRENYLRGRKKTEIENFSVSKGCEGGKEQMRSFHQIDDSTKEASNTGTSNSRIKRNEIGWKEKARRDREPRRFKRGKDDFSRKWGAKKKRRGTFCKNFLTAWTVLWDFPSCRERLFREMVKKCKNEKVRGMVYLTRNSVRKKEMIREDRHRDSSYSLEVLEQFKQELHTREKLAQKTPKTKGDQKRRWMTSNHAMIRRKSGKSEGEEVCPQSYRQDGRCLKMCSNTP